MQGEERLGLRPGGCGDPVLCAVRRYRYRVGRFQRAAQAAARVSELTG